MQRLYALALLALLAAAPAPAVRAQTAGIIAVVNGDVIATETRTSRRRSGFVGINVQGAKAAIRKVEIQPR